MFDQKNTPPDDFQKKNAGHSDLTSDTPANEKKRPRPLANPEAMPQSAWKYEKPSPKKEEPKREKIVPVLKSLADTEAMPGPKKVEGKHSPREKEEKKQAQKEDLFVEIFNRSVKSSENPGQTGDSLLGKASETEDEKSGKDIAKKIGIQKFILKKKTKEKDISAENNESPEKKEENSLTEEIPFLSDLPPEEMVKKSLDGMYGVFDDPAKNPRKKLKPLDVIRYAVLFICIFGFFSAGAFVFSKLYNYYRAHVIYSRLQEMVEEKDFFHKEYLAKSQNSVKSLTPQDILEGKSEDRSESGSAFSEEQQTLVGKISQLKKINPDTAGWITIDGTVVNYPVVWSETKNYYLRRDFYGKYLSGGTLFIDQRNSPNVAENRNTVIYGHNMKDGSMFASIHDFANASAFYRSTIEIATEEGIFVYKPFSAHESNAYDNYFETEFVSDEDFIHFCEQMAFISIFETDHSFDKNSQILTLSTCADEENTKDERFAVHAVLVEVIR